MPGIGKSLGLRITGLVAAGTALGAGALVVGGCGSGGDRGQRPVAVACQRPYTASSPWNTPIGASAAAKATPAAIRGTLTSDPTQYTYPLYEVGPSTPSVRVTVRGRFSDVTAGGHRLVIRAGGSVRIPIPADAAPAAGTDAQIIVLDRDRGDEWGVWRLRRSSAGWEVENGYHYNARWSGVPPHDVEGRPFGSRGAGVPYLAGLVRPCEIERGRIGHALAFAYDFPGPRHVYPATKSDGAGDGAAAVPEGTRLQLDPALSAESLRARGCDGPCLVIARALQRYGMYVIDNSGRPKVMLEYEDTAGWNGLVDAATVSPIPLSDFRIVPQGDGR